MKDWYVYIGPAVDHAGMFDTREEAEAWCRKQMKQWTICGVKPPQFKVHYNGAGKHAPIIVTP